MGILEVVSLSLVVLFLTLNGGMLSAWMIAATMQPGSWERVRFYWEPRYLWVGLRYLPQPRRITLYVCPFPAMCFRLIRNVYPPEGEPGEAWFEMLDTLSEPEEPPPAPEPPAPAAHPYDCDCPGCISGGG